jgi:hypothetical protein
MKKTILLLVLSITLSNLYTQNNIYYTRDAILQVNGEFNNQFMFGQTRALNITLDYETTKILIRFKPSALKFNIDTLNNIIENENAEVVFRGELSLDYINVNNQAPLEFVVQGHLELGQKKIKINNGKGELHHINDSGDFSSMLGMTFLFNLNDLDLNIPTGLFEEVEIVITQALLKDDKN